MKRRGWLLLASGLAAGAIAPLAAADPTSTTPAPDPNPPAGAAPDPYKPAPKATPTKTTPAPVHVAPRVYTPPHVVYTTPRVVTPVHAATQSSGSSSTSAPTSRPVVARARVTHTARKAPRHKHRRPRPAVHHTHKPVIVRVTPAVRSYVVSFVDKLSATVVDPARDSVTPGRRRAAGLALVVLCAASLSLVLLSTRRAREQAA